MSDEKRATVTLSIAEWNLVLGQLAEGPFRVVAPLIGTIREQAMQALAPPAPATNGPLEVGEGDHGLAHR